MAQGLISLSTTTGHEIVQSSLLQRFEVIVPPVLALLCCFGFLVHCSTPCFVISSLPFFSDSDFEGLVYLTLFFPVSHQPPGSQIR
jgi:hypothetical protein